MRAPWELDKAFMAVAAVAWADDLATATARGGLERGEYNARAQARSRMKLRREGFRHAEEVERRLFGLQVVVQVLEKRLGEMIKHVKREQPGAGS